MLTINQLNKSYGTKKILDNVSLTLKPGQITFLLGASGVGKSTLLRILNNLETYESGSILLDDKPLDHMFTPRHVGMVFQQWHLFEHLTALENISLALEKVLGLSLHDAQEKALVLLTHYGLGDKAHQYPRDLSGGQKQRLALARMLALKPRIVCLDEPTSALDPVLTAHVAQTIKELADEGFTVLITTHDTSLVHNLPEATIHLMDAGRIVESAHEGGYTREQHKHQRIHTFISGTQL